jgi:hypothetical protein
MAQQVRSFLCMKTCTKMHYGEKTAQHTPSSPPPPPELALPAHEPAPARRTTIKRRFFDILVVTVTDRAGGDLA